MPKAKKLPSGNYRVQVSKTIDGITYKQSFTASTKAEAEYIAEKWKRGIIEKTKPENMTLKEACEKYIELKRPMCSPTTIEGYEKIVRNYFSDYMDMKISSFTNLKLEEMVSKECARPIKRRNSYERLSPKSIKNAYHFIVTVLKKYAPHINTNIILPENPDKVVEVLSPDVIYSIVKGTEIELPVLLSMWLSLSMSELRGLKKSTSLQGTLLIIKEVIVDVEGLPIVKNKGKEQKRTRALIVPDYIMELINKVDGDIIVQLTGKQLYKKFTKLLKDNNLPHMTFHQLRHVNASTMALLNIPEKYAQERGGWKTPHTMKKVYQHTFTEERQAVDEKINNYFEKIIKK